MNVLHTVGLATFAPELVEHLDDVDHPRCVLRGLVEFREHLGGRLTIMLPSDVGRGCEVHHMDLATVRRCVAALRPGGLPE
jgi:3-dehydroquinate synthase